MTELVSHWSALHWAVLVVAVTVGALVQASVGFGFALIAAPFLMFVSHEFVPGPMLACSTLLSAGVALREWRHMDRRIVGWTLVGRIPGVWLGAFLVALVSEHALELLFGASVLLGVAMSLSGLRVEPTTRVLLGTGAVSGLMGTLSAIGGPPIALLNQHQEGPRLRATLCAYFTVGCVFSTVALALVGRFGVHELIVSALMLPPTAAGFVLARYTRRFLDAGHTRKGVLAIALISGMAVIAKALVSIG
jgi:uncharacterized membrane protein YfcA